MKKQLICFIAILSVLIFNPSFSFAGNKIDSSVRIAIKKYKTGNYTGCLQSCQAIIKRNPSSAYAYYYMAMSYAQAGKKNEAVNAYAKVLNLHPTAKLAEYASTGKRCLETPEKCTFDANSGSGFSPELDKLIDSPFSDGLSDTVRKDFEQKHLNNIKNEINNGKEFDDYQFQKINNNSDNELQADNVKIASKKPTNDEIVAALKVLSEAGLNPYSQAQVPPADTINPYAQVSDYQNPQSAQLNMLMSNNSQLNNNGAIMNMLPFMLNQNRGDMNNYSPQMMQAVIMNSLMPNLNIDLNTAKDSDR